MEANFGSWEFSRGGVKTYNFDISYGGFIGVYGDNTDMINTLGPFYNPGVCSCDESQLAPSALSDMVASVSSGAAALQTIPVFYNTYEAQGRGSCGGQIFTIAQADGSSVASFLSLSNSELTLQTTDPALIGEYSIRLTVTMEDYPTIQTYSDFTVRLLILASGPSYEATKTLVSQGGPYTAVNSCYTEPDFGYTLVRGMQTSESELPSYASYDLSAISVTADP